jgi:outer membrane protein assembly factor BamB
MATNWFWAKPVVYKGTIYAGCLDGKVYALNAATGEKVAEIDLASPVSSSPVVVDDSIIVASEEGKIYAIYTGDNQKKELFDLEVRVDAPLSVSDGVIYVHTQKKEALHALDARRGLVLWMLPLTSK